MKSDFSTFVYGKITDFPMTTYTSSLSDDDDIINVIHEIPITIIQKKTYIKI